MRVVVKVGTSTLAHSTGCLNIRQVEMLCKVLSDLKNAGHEIILVSSGAIGMGMGKLPIQGRPTDMPTKQAAAAVGQCELMYTYDKLFTEYNADRKENFENTLYRLLELGVRPIINENDTIATKEIAVGDNDTLAAIVTVCAKADLLILLSDIDGLYTADPHTDKSATLISTVDNIDDRLYALAGESGSLGTGGMATKLHAADIVTKQGVDMVITNGSRPEDMYDILEGKQIGTRFVGGKK